MKSGDVVRLRSGGPEMTVYKVSNAYGDGDSARCAWFTEGDNGLECREDNFPVPTLEMVRERKEDILPS